MKVSGKNVFKEINIKDIKKIYLSNNFSDKEIISKIQKNNIKYIKIDQRELDKMILNNQGIITEIDDYKYSNLEDSYNDSLVVVLDHLEDPHNFGAIIRTCEARGVKNIIIPKDRSARVNETVMKVSAGTLNRVNIIMVSNIVKTLEKLKDENFFVYAADMDGEDYKNISYTDKVALVIGNEGKGISNLVKKVSDIIIKIPMEGKVNSLNASVAAGILLFGINK